MGTITVRLNKEEEEIYTKYAKFSNAPLSTLMKEALMEKIENEIDLKTVSEYEKRLEDKEVEYYSLNETKRILGL
jgi:predicted DNA-binding protein